MVAPEPAAPHVPAVVAVSRDGAHRFSKPTTEEVRLLEGLGVDGDAHAGVTVQHRSRVARDPSRPNLRQVHLVHSELHDELRAQGLPVGPGELGENVTTRGVDLLGLPRGTVLRLGPEAEVEVTGLRNPCRQIDDFRPGALRAVLDRDAAGRLVRKAGVMAVVRRGGRVAPGDAVVVVLPDGAHEPLQPV
ncbi:MOSC domain-containing protein YiiM [Kineococcus xinjiangensis]|uniref:MOSC domain-containing protein YiiM n=1 Tax=Kineococcus xinjiangensis TaxID=512762 RepID=A0A2S6IFE7_9ACTN|nr:MOSC domain-containing protein [Kineococcus xinjiangensis]PPK92931.1 MOSC domain-containing protein YiiM [Kineococcus xinjiangensis]